MIERDGCDGDDFCLRGRRRIETPAQTRLKNCKPDTHLAESHESDGRQMLEECRQRFKPAFIKQALSALTNLCRETREVCA